MIQSEDTTHPKAPHPKVTASVFGGATATLVAWVVSVTAGLDMPGVVVGALATVVMGVTGYLKRGPM